MALTSKISPYDPQWPFLFTREKHRLAEGFAAELIDIHHVGSTAVPGLCAKPEIDILVVVSEHLNEAARNGFMQTLGYGRGSDLSTDHHFYRRDVDGVRTHKIHVCAAGHGQIARMLRFRDLLRENASIRQQYQDLKLQLEATNCGGIAEYLARKAPCIDAWMSRYPET
ncbi:GrpB family protein [Pseudomonas sp. MWU15-20650]|uniref:GrpB family protein n=1 Tax=Pseudomonas sp. MWU15-20650 TaxID=2933107 RepID=UPI0020107138|nr:GrpB family protein [Pseudomonas sp. MWU15-20650]